MEKLRTMCLVVVFVLGIFGIYCGDADAGWSQNFDLQGIHLSASAGGYEETAYANCWGHLQQGVNGRYYQYENSNISFYTDRLNPSEFYLNASWDFLVVGEENYIPDLGINASQSNNINAFGISLFSHSDVRNYDEWVYDGMEWHLMLTDDIALSFSFNLKPACMEDIGLWVNEWRWGEDPVVRDTLWISFSGQGYFVADTPAGADALGSMFMIPEPATVALLGLGGLFLRKKK